jgi:hypothetical protein
MKQNFKVLQISLTSIPLKTMEVISPLLLLTNKNLIGPPNLRSMRQTFEDKSSIRCNGVSVTRFYEAKAKNMRNKCARTECKQSQQFFAEHLGDLVLLSKRWNLFLSPQKSIYTMTVHIRRTLALPRERDARTRQRSYVSHSCGWKGPRTECGPLADRVQG